ncbi:RTA1 like protein-domain-containing protein [Staphylotrichum tortipilum]|uniref:RTA1 like protein-domain-containing protein n=1 Tax=Staphylotrichum tortipilum TaxID=2831512 RepID=A0AAN6MTL1_9PEZI|nr:RTA1 like protein-domain-containing protein [Staphylotrichum longicolle]
MSYFADCSGETCPVPYGAAPAGNAFILAAFAALIPPVVYAGLRYRILSHTLFLSAAVIVEIVGHVGKILLVSNPTSHVYSVVYLLGTHWGAVLLGSAVNLVLPHVLVLYGKEFRVVSDPVYMNIFFFILDIFTLAFQSVGIGFAATANTATESSQGVNILLTGLAIQIVSLITFLGTYRYFLSKLSHRRYILDDTYAPVYSSHRFKYFIICVQAVAAILLVRTAVRIAVFASGLNGPLAQSQVASFLLDDTLVLVAALILTVYPVGRAFGEAWAETSPRVLADRSDGLPLRHRHHRRNRSSQINHHVISLPYQSPAASPRFSPGFTPRSGMTPGLPAHPSPRGAPSTGVPSPRTPASAPPLASPRNYPVHQRAPYDATPAQTVPFMAPQESPGLDSAMWGMASPGEPGRKRRMRAVSAHETQMVQGDSLWD